MTNKLIRKFVEYVAKMHIGILDQSGGKLRPTTVVSYLDALCTAFYRRGRAVNQKIQYAAYTYIDTVLNKKMHLLNLDMREKPIVTPDDMTTITTAIFS